MSFAPRRSEKQLVSEIGLAAWIEEQLSPETIDDSPLDWRLRPYEILHASADDLFNCGSQIFGGFNMEPILDDLRARRIEPVSITLHVGYGTFKPVRVENVEEHEVDPEVYSVSPATADPLTRALRGSRRIIAVGTTTTRALESLTLGPGDVVQPSAASTSLFIRPGHRFRIVQGLVTNFHLPRSSLLMLVAAFTGRERILAAYREAVEQRYRFYSYGDAMLIQ